MYLSRLILNPKSREVRRDLANCHEMHRTLLRAFTEVPAGVSDPRSYFEVLYRVETDRKTGLPRVYIQSACLPDWSRLPESYFADVAENPASKPVLRQYEELQVGTVLSFVLKANPTRKVGTKLKCEKGLNREGKNGHRVCLYKLEEQMKWLTRKAEQNGFELLSVKINPKVPDLIASPPEDVHGWRKSATAPFMETDKLTFGSVSFYGHLRIKDKEKFLSGVKSGIGSGKAYGFGMLSLAAAR